MHGRAVFALLTLALLLPVASAEFGAESEDGYPITTDGRVLRPPVIPVVTTYLDPELAKVYGLDQADPLNKVGPFTLYPYYPLLTGELQRLARDHPDLVKLTSAGKSTAGLDQWLLEIADFTNPDMIPLEEREVVYLDGGTHSNEYSGVYFVTEWAQFLLDEYETNETAKWIVQNRHTWILPLINPDGSNAFGRINAKAININRNFPGTWGTVDEDPIMNNPGPSPASEIETQNVIKLLETIQPDYINSIHCCGNLWLHPYGAEELENPADLQMYTRICDEVFADVRDRCGEIWSTIYPASGTTADAGYELIGASSWTYEMSGRGRIAGPWAEPVTREDVRVQERESWAGVMDAFLNVHKYGARPKVVAAEGDASTLSITVANIGYGNMSGASLMLSGVWVELPTLMPGERATVTVAGSFAAGETMGELNWIKRERHQTPGTQKLSVTLADEGGRLVGVFPTDDEIGQLSTPAAENLVPGVGPLMLVGLVVAMAVALRRKW